MRFGVCLSKTREKALLMFSTVVCLLALSLVLNSPAFAAPLCEKIFSELDAEIRRETQFIHERNPRLHLSDFVEGTARAEQRTSGVYPQKPTERLQLWLVRLEAISEKSSKSPWALNAVKQELFREHVMKYEDVPESHYRAQAQIARNRGHGDIPLSAEFKRQQAELVIRDQAKSLEPWIDFMVTPSMKIYPMWAKYWMFTGMTKLSKFNPVEGTFGSRTKETVAPYPELNQEAVGLVMELILKRLNRSSLAEISDPVLLSLVQNANFGKMYGHALKVVGGTFSGQFRTNEGVWVLYRQGSDPAALMKTLEGQNTGWCTANQASAEAHLAQGNFHIYYSLDAQGKPTVPRLAIRMEYDQIAEVRGVGPEQNFDAQISKSSVLAEKMKEFGGQAKAYETKDQDMRRLTAIEQRNKMGSSLSKEDLQFLYERDREILGFGQSKDPRIEEIILSRDIKSDLVIVWDYKYTREQIAVKSEEIIYGKTRLFYGDLILENTSSSHLWLPEHVTGRLQLDEMTSAVGLRLPRIVAGGLSLRRLNSAEGLHLPETLHGLLDLSYLHSATHLKLPKVLRGDLILDSLVSAKDLQLPEVIQGRLSLESLTSAAGLRFPKMIEQGLYLSSLTSAEGLKLPSTIRGDLSLEGLVSPIGLRLPESLYGNLFLNSLTSSVGLQLPSQVTGVIFLKNLDSAKNLSLPEGFPLKRYYGPLDF